MTRIGRAKSSFYLVGRSPGQRSRQMLQSNGQQSRGACQHSFILASYFPFFCSCPRSSWSVIIVAGNRACSGTISFPVTRDWQSAQGNHDVGVVLLIDERLKTRAGHHLSAGGRNLVEVLSNYGYGPDQMIDRENGLADAHREQAVRVSYSEVRFVEFTVSRPIGDQAGVSGPQDRQAIGEADDVARFAPLVTRQAGSDTRGIQKYWRGARGVPSRNRRDFHALALASECNRDRPSSKRGDAGGLPGHGDDRVCDSRHNTTRRSRSGDILDLLCEEGRHFSTDRKNRVVSAYDLGGIAVRRELKRCRCRAGAVGMEDISNMVPVWMIDQDDMHAP